MGNCSLLSGCYEDKQSDADDTVSAEEYKDVKDHAYLAAKELAHANSLALSRIKKEKAEKAREANKARLLAMEDAARKRVKDETQPILAEQAVAHTSTD